MHTLEDVYTQAFRVCIATKYFQAFWVFIATCTVLFLFFIFFCDLLPRVCRSLRKPKSLNRPLSISNPISVSRNPSNLGHKAYKTAPRSLRHRQTHGTSEKNHKAVEESQTDKAKGLDRAHQMLQAAERKAWSAGKMGAAWTVAAVRSGLQKGALMVLHRSVRVWQRLHAPLLYVSTSLIEACASVLRLCAFVLGECVRVLSICVAPITYVATVAQAACRSYTWVRSKVVAPSVRAHVASSPQESTTSTGSEVATRQSRRVGDEQPSARVAMPAETECAVGDGKSCCVCLDAPREVALLPCGHVALCFACASTLANKRPSKNKQSEAKHGGYHGCPICRKRIDSVARVYFP
mmetsp:Transcript_45322/g.75599  ORF Transcript_45322/g.75599 Transcript_45322/m.75599 type:complete len:351 (-) Transcript_45322:24-1076(-)